MGIKVTIPNTSSDTLTFGSANTTTAAQIAGIDSGSSNGQLALYTTASGTSTERVRVDASGNVGIGTASPDTSLAVRSTGANGINLGESLNNSVVSSRLFFSNATAGQSAAIYNNSGGLLFTTGATLGSGSGTERMRITSDGDLNVKRQVLSITTNGFGVFAAGSTVTVADGATITLSSGSSAQLICIACASTGTGGTFFANYNVTVSQIGGSSTSISTTDAGTVDIACYKSANSNTVTFKNRSGSSKVYNIAMFCGQNGGTV